MSPPLRPACTPSPVFIDLFYLFIYLFMLMTNLCVRKNPSLIPAIRNSSPAKPGDRNIPSLISASAVVTGVFFAHRAMYGRRDRRRAQRKASFGKTSTGNCVVALTVPPSPYTKGNTFHSNAGVRCRPRGGGGEPPLTPPSSTNSTTDLTTAFQSTSSGASAGCAFRPSNHSPIS